MKSVFLQKVFSLWSQISVITPSIATRLMRGKWLRIVRGAWVVIALLCMIHVIASLPLLFMQGTCPGGGCLTASSLEELRIAGFSLNALVISLVSLDVVFFVACFVVSLFIFWRSSQEGMAIYTAFMLITFGATAFAKTDMLTVHCSVWYSIVVMVALLGQVLFLLFFYLFPNGQFIPDWTRLMAGLLVILMGWLYLVPTSLAARWLSTTLPLWATLFIASAAFAQIYRYRNMSNMVQRQQSKWVMFGLVATIIVYQGMNLSLLIFSIHDVFVRLVSDTVSAIGLIFIPLSIGIAMLHYRLWDIDLLINRTVVYSALTVCMVGLYVLIVGGLAALFQSSNNVVFSLIATGCVAVFVQALRVRLQRSVNRLMYGDRDDPYTVLARLGQRLEATLAPEALLETIVETIAQALKLPYAAIMLSGQETMSAGASWGKLETTEQTDVLRLALTAGNEHVGEMVLAARAPHELFSEADQRLLRELANRAGLVVHASQLTEDLRKLTIDLQHSRERLVVTREEERRRIRRDLHDGIAPTLAALALSASTIGELIPVQPSTAKAMANDLQQEIRATIADIRRMVYDLRPPMLDELGLMAAIDEYVVRQTGYAGRDTNDEIQGTQKGLQVTVRTGTPIAALPAAMEVAAFRIVQEGLSNVMRHAQAHSCLIELSLTDQLQIEIIDDGIGIPAQRRIGVGLISMRERATELGGTCSIENRINGTGTRVVVILPFKEFKE